MKITDFIKKHMNFYRHLLKNHPELLQECFSAQRIRDVNLRKQMIKEFFEINKRLPSKKSKDPKEKSLGRSIGHYCSKSSGMFDPTFKAWKESIKPSNTSELNKQAIKEFYNNHGRLPSAYSADSDESRLGSRLGDYISEAGDAFDREFRYWKLTCK